MRPDLVNQQTKAPTRKMKYGGIAGLITVLCIAGVEYFMPGMGDVFGPALAAIITLAASGVVGYFTRERA